VPQVATLNQTFQSYSELDQHLSLAFHKRAQTLAFLSHGDVCFRDLEVFPCFESVPISNISLRSQALKLSLS
jgi:hypothetical protein